MDRQAEDLFKHHVPKLLQCCTETEYSYREMLSTEINSILDEIGYSEEKIKEHVQHFTKVQRAKVLWHRKFQESYPPQDRTDSVIVGSQVEGSMLYDSSDIDGLIILYIPQVYEAVTECVRAEEDSLVIDTHLVPPGYCMLKSNKPDTTNTMKSYVSSHEFLTQIADLNSDVSDGGPFLHVTHSSVHGPSVPLTFNRKNTSFRRQNFSADQAFAIRCHYPSVLKVWKHRLRPYSWPTTEILDKVAAMPVFVVPISEKGSSFEDLQWRFCFNFGEIILTHSWNNIQMKIFILLKMISVQLLKPICDDITSFVMKNIVFWLAETKPMHEFNPSKVIDRLTDALTMLRDAIQAKKLCYYMIPERNLLAGKVNDIQQKELIDFLNHMITNHGQEFVKLHISGESVDKETQSMAKIKSKFVSMYVCNLEDRHESLFMIPFTTEELATKLEEGNYNHFGGHYSILSWRLFVTAFRNIFQVYQRFGLKLFYDPHGINHESVIDTEMDVDDYSMWICDTCQVYSNRDKELTESIT